MMVRAAHRIRWAAVWTLLVGWFLGLMLNVGGAAVNLLLFLGLAILVYELLAAEPRA